MKKIKLALLSTAIVSTMLGSILAFVMIGASAPAPAPTPIKIMFTYTAKWICNTPFTTPNGTFVNTGSAESIGLVPAEYKTDVNVHNPGPANATIVKKFVLSVPESPFLPKSNVTAFSKTFAGPDLAFFVTCDEIQRLLNLPNGQALKGFVILTTSVSNLDVVAEYTSETFDFSPECPFASFPPSTANPNCVEGSTLSVQKVSAVSVTGLICSLPPSSTIVAAPSSLTIPVGATATSTITITNNSCFTITECFTTTITPPTGITASISPTCITLPPGGSGPATLVISAFSPGTYIITVTATCGPAQGCNPTLVQTATITVTV